MPVYAISAKVVIVQYETYTVKADSEDDAVGMVVDRLVDPESEDDGETICTEVTGVEVVDGS